MSVNMARYGVVSQLKCTWTCIAGEEPDLGREGNVILTTTTTSAALFIYLFIYIEKKTGPVLHLVT